MQVFSLPFQILIRSFFFPSKKKTIMADDEFDDNDVGSSALQQALDQKSKESELPVEKLLANILEVMKTQKALTERMLTAVARGQTSLDTGNVFTVTIAPEFVGALNDFHVTPSLGTWTAQDRTAMFPKHLSKEEIDRLFPEGTALVVGVHIFQVKSTFPCRLNLNLPQFKSLEKTETTGTKEACHFVVKTRMDMNERHSLLNGENAKSASLGERFPGYTPNNIATNGVMVDPRDPTVTNLHRNQPAICTMVEGLLAMKSPEATATAKELLDRTEVSEYVPVGTEMAKAAIKQTEQVFSRDMKVVKLTDLANFSINRGGLDWNSTDGLVPKTGNYATIALEAALALNADKQVTGKPLTVSGAVPTTLGQLNGKTATAGAPDTTKQSINAKLTDMMLAQQYSLGFKVEFQIRSTVSSGL